MRNHSSLFSFPIPLSYLERRFVPNTTHTFLECRECFGAWEVLGICQKKPVSLGGCNQAYCGIQKASEDKTPRSPLVAGAWRAQVRWVDYSCTPTYSLVDQFRLGGSRKGFLPNSSISSSITRLGIIMCLHLSSLTIVLFFYCL